ncbi:MAG: hypothetical protein L0Z49_13235 [Actinobacteria bacterium]|nr:hypothetical protein [Actinomycetota bacterium]MCI0678243.1 hypothetical protein [Actinomycetota bacterium]
MNPEDELRRAADRVRAGTERVPVPSPPTAGRWRRPVTMGIAAVATLGLVGLGLRVTGGLGGEDFTVPTTQATATTLTPTIEDSTYRGAVTVIDAGDAPVVCAGGVAESLPPQCGGVPLVGLDWTDVPWAETASGVTWAEMTITVRYDTEQFHLLTAPEVAEYPLSDPVDFTPPCDPPPGGWVWTNDPRATPQHMEDVIAYANGQADRSAVWVYSLMDDPEEADQTGRQEYVVVALFTGDLGAHEAAMRELWGGPLCVALGATNARELEGIQAEVTNLLLEGEVPGVVGFGYSYIDEIGGQVGAGALIITAEAETWAAERFGEGVVRFESTLIPTG